MEFQKFCTISQERFRIRCKNWNPFRFHRVSIFFSMSSLLTSVYHFLLISVKKVSALWFFFVLLYFISLFIGIYLFQPSIVPLTLSVYLIFDEICTRIMISNDDISPSSPDSSTCSSTSIIDVSHSDVSIVYSSPSSTRGIKPAESQSMYTSVSVKRSLLHDPTHYLVVSNNSKRATFSC